MSALADVPTGWTTKPLWSMFARKKDVNHPEETMLSVFREHGVVVKSSHSNFNQTADDRSIYQLIDRGWLVVNRMKAWQGSVGISPHRGILSGHYICFEPRHDESPRYLDWLLRSATYVDEYKKLSRGVRPGQAEIDNNLLRNILVRLPHREDQQRIAGFLDKQVALLDHAIRLRNRQLSLVRESGAERIRSAVLGLSEEENRVPVSTAWIGTVPHTWTVQPLGRAFRIELGKMLSSERSSGASMKPYLRNTNVQWDRIETNNLLMMDFPPAEQARYRVLPGDLLVCEGGDVGRAAIWDGVVEEVYYQKALHRLRPLTTTSARWAYYLLRAATSIGVFTTETETTIAHLTGEQLRAHRFPFPPPSTEHRLVDYLDRSAASDTNLTALLSRQVALLQERKQALITAAVTGQLDVTTARSKLGVDAP